MCTPNDGLLSEAAGWNDAGLHVITVWETKAQHDRFVTDLEDVAILPVDETANH